MANTRLLKWSGRHVTSVNCLWKSFQPGEDGVNVFIDRARGTIKVRLCRVQRLRYGEIQNLTCGNFDPSGDMECG